MKFENYTRVHSIVSELNTIDEELKAWNGSTVFSNNFRLSLNVGGKDLFVGTEGVAFDQIKRHSIDFLTKKKNTLMKELESL